MHEKKTKPVLIVSPWANLSSVDRKRIEKAGYLVVVTDPESITKLQETDSTVMLLQEIQLRSALTALEENKTSNAMYRYRQLVALEISKLAQPSSSQNGGEKK